MEVKELMEIAPIYFSEPLTEGVILARKNPFIMVVQVCGQTVACHCPTTWHIGNLEVAGRPCLLSKNAGTDRKTPYTVEAVSLNQPEDPGKQWIGINLTAANRYVEYYLENGGFAGIVGRANRIHRERLSGKANLDFVVGGAALAVKAPLLVLGLDVPAEMRVAVEKPFPSTERFLRRITALRESSPASRRVVLLTVYLYDRPKFHISEYGGYGGAVRPVAARSVSLGIENWQANFVLSEQCVRLDRYMPLSTAE